MNSIGYLESLKNSSISSMSDFNRVSHISGGLLFRCYRRSTFVTCQIIFPQHVTFICQNSIPQSCRLFHVQLNDICRDMRVIWMLEFLTTWEKLNKISKMKHEPTYLITKVMKGVTPEPGNLFTLMRPEFKSGPPPRRWGRLSRWLLAEL